MSPSKKDRIIKVCGMTQPVNIESLSALPIDWIGHIYYAPSKRNMDPNKALDSSIYGNKKRIGVFVNEDLDTVLEFINRFDLDGVQLHGDESREYVERLRDNFEGLIIKAIGIENAEDLLKTESYDDLIDYFLFDTKTPSKGGSGVAFDWSILDEYAGKTPFLLSGGLSLENCQDLMSWSHPKLAGYDLNSRFETEPGTKDIEKIKQFIDEIYN